MANAIMEGITQILINYHCKVSLMIILFFICCHAIIAIPQLPHFAMATGQTGDRDQKLVVMLT